MYFVKKCIRAFETLFVKTVKIYLLIGIYWKYLIELKLWNQKKNFLNPGKMFRQRCRILKRDESTFSSGASPGSFKILVSPSPRVDDLKDVECFKCHKKGNYANKRPESKAKDGKGWMKMRKIDDFGPKYEA